MVTLVQCACNAKRMRHQNAQGAACSCWVNTCPLVIRSSMLNVSSVQIARTTYQFQRRDASLWLFQQTAVTSQCWVSGLPLRARSTTQSASSVKDAVTSLQCALAILFSGQHRCKECLDDKPKNMVPVNVECLQASTRHDKDAYDDAKVGCVSPRKRAASVCTDLVRPNHNDHAIQAPVVHHRILYKPPTQMVMLPMVQPVAKLGVYPDVQSSTGEEKAGAMYVPER